MKTQMIRELRRNWRSFRYQAFLLVLLFFALLDPPVIKYMNELMGYLVEGVDASVFPEPTAEMALETALSDISGIGFLVLIFIVMGSVAREKETGVTAWLLSKPVGRGEYLMAKLIVLYGVVVLGLFGAVTISYLYTWTLLGQVSLAGTFWSTVSLTVYALFLATLTFTCSVLFRTPLQAGGVSAVIFMLSGLFNVFISELKAARFYPNTLLNQIGPLIEGYSGPSDILWTKVLTLSLCALLVFLAWYRFSRTEL